MTPDEQKAERILRIAAMTPEERLDHILQLPRAERCQLFEDVWGSLAVAPDPDGVPQWHLEELNQRLDDPTEQATLSWNDVRSRLGRAKR